MASSRLDAWLRRVVFAPETVGAGWLSRALLFLYFWLREAHRKDLNVRAMALAYQLLFSIVPAAAVAASLFASLPALAGSREQFISTVLSPILPIEETNIVDHVARFAENATAVGTVGGLVLLYFTVNLARTTETSVNDLWEVRRKRTLIQSWSGMALMLLVGTTLVALWLRSIGPTFARLLSDVAGGGSWLLSVTLSFGAFYLFYLLLPYTRVRWWAAAIGAGFSTAGWLGAKALFAGYAARMVTTSLIYGALAVLPLFLLWLYVSWLVALLGCLAARVAQDFRHLEDDERYRLGGVRHHVYWALVILREIGLSFRASEGRTPDLAELATACGQPASLFEEMAGRMARHGLLVPWDGRRNRYVLARPPESIALSRVPIAVERDPFGVPDPHGDQHPSESEKRVADLLRTASAPEHSQLAAATLSDLMDRPPGPAPEGASPGPAPEGGAPGPAEHRD
jgi:membrane protein